MSTQNLCTSFLLECLEAYHDFRTDVLKLALYTVTLDPATVTAYSATNEASGSGYSAGGFTLSLTAGYPKLSTTSGVNKALVDFADIAQTPAAFTARAGLIYNSSKSNRAIAVLDFGLSYIAASSFGIVWPPPDDSNCIIRLGA